MLFYDDKTLAQEITDRSLRFAKIDMAGFTPQQFAEASNISSLMTSLTFQFTVHNTVMRAFLVYAVYAAVTSTIGLIAGVNPVVIVLTNIAIAAGIAAWQTYTLYLYSTTIKTVLAEYDSFLSRAEKKDNE